HRHGNPPPAGLSTAPRAGRPFPAPAPRLEWCIGRSAPSLSKENGQEAHPRRRRPRAHGGARARHPRRREAHPVRGGRGGHGHGVPEGHGPEGALRPHPPGREPAGHGRLQRVPGAAARGDARAHRLRDRPGRPEGLRGGPGGRRRLLPGQADLAQRAQGHRRPLDEHRPGRRARALQDMIIGAPAPAGTVVVLHLSPSRGEALARMLRSGSHRAIVVAPGPGAVDAIVAAAPDLLLGPLVCGDATLAEVAEQARRKMASGFTVMAVLGREDADAFIDADGIIREPVDAGELLFRAGRLLRHEMERRTLRHKIDELLGLHRVASWAFSIAGGAESLFGHLARQSASILKAEKGLIMLYDPQRREMEGKNVAFGLTPQQVARIRYPVDGEARELWNFRLNGPLVTNSARTDPRLLPDLAAVLDIFSLIVVPMTRGPQVLGLIAVADRAGRAPFRDEDLGTLQAVAGQATVAVENQRLHEQIKEANARLQEFDRIKSEFVATVAHDFRSPLMSIRGFAELTLEEPDLPPERRNEFMRTIIAETDDLARLANDTLLISHMETGQLHYDLKPVDVRRALKDAVPPGLTTHSLVVDVPDDFPVIRADPGRLRQVLHNLVSNALKYS